MTGHKDSFHTLDTVEGKQQVYIYPVEKFMIHQLLCCKQTGTRVRFVTIFFSKSREFSPFSLLSPFSREFSPFT
jgi:hypothetical protein